MKRRRRTKRRGILDTVRRSFFILSAELSCVPVKKKITRNTVGLITCPESGGQKCQKGKKLACFFTLHFLFLSLPIISVFWMRNGPAKRRHTQRGKPSNVQLSPICSQTLPSDSRTLPLLNTQHDWPLVCLLSLSLSNERVVLSCAAMLIGPFF